MEDNFIEEGYTYEIIFKEVSGEVHEISGMTAEDVLELKQQVLEGKTLNYSSHVTRIGERNARPTNTIIPPHALSHCLIRVE